MEIELTVEIVMPDDGPPCYLWKSDNGDYSIAVWKSDLIPTLSINPKFGAITVTWNRPPTPDEEQEGGIKFSLGYPTVI